MAYQQGDTLVLIQTQNPSGSSGITFTNLPTEFKQFYLTYSNLLFSGGVDELWSRISTDNGSTWLSTGYIAGNQAFINGSTTIFNSSLTSAYLLAFSINGTNTVNGSNYFYNINTSNSPMENGSYVFWNGANTVFGLSGGYNTTTNANAIQIFPKVTTFTGQISLYGIKT